MPDRYQKSVHNSAPEVALAYTVYGDPVEDTGRPSSTGDNIAPVVWSVFRDFEEPIEVPVVEAARCQFEGCRGFASKATGYCPGHGRSLGLIPNWSSKKKASDEPD